ncbi:hypothetical protein ACFFHH_15160 [Cytobacillus solani]|uniref:hypothetical protein n=1 Tax=Cytobacillus solani TaxID=1637975 RepID=UPI0006ABEC81|nr:hypothetical protein [Cytobacillus solani]KOP81343.1 hypothetical protein AMS60_01855 [Bacillus sp. FJAT-21945]
MEKNLIKVSIYSFITSFLVLFFLLDRTKSTKDTNGITSSEVISYPDYFFMILKYSVGITIGAVIIALIIKSLNKKRLSKKLS